MPVPDYMIHESKEYIESRGYTFKDFSEEQNRIAHEFVERSARLEIKNHEYSRFFEERYKSQGFIKKNHSGIAGGCVFVKE